MSSGNKRQVNRRRKGEVEARDARLSPARKMCERTHCGFIPLRLRR